MVRKSKNVLTVAFLSGASFLMVGAGLVVSVPAQAEDPALSEADKQHQMAMRHLEETRNEIRLMQAHGIGMGTVQ